MRDQIETGPLPEPDEYNRLKATSATAPSPAKRRIGPYELLDTLGEGGFGVVWLAERREPYVQRVALKIIRPGKGTRDVIARFESERQTLARLNHPSIAKVLDGGTTDDGQPYFVMEYVPGDPITTFCDKARMTIDARLELVAQVCEGVQHAHEKGIIHRDISPSNILVSYEDGLPSAKVIDFGVARALDAAPGTRGLTAEFGAIIGKPEYMSPEQAEMGPVDIDTRSDIYAVGALMYELLTGALPIESRRVRGTSDAEVRRVIREDDAPNPSALLQALREQQMSRAAEIARLRGTTLTQLLKRLRPELDWIVMKCLHKDRGQRYDSASALASDLRRVLAREPVPGCPYTAMMRARSLLRRHRTMAAAVVVALGACIGGTALALRAAERERTARLEADVQRDIALAVNAFVTDDLFGALNPERSGASVKVIDLLEPAVESAQKDFKDKPLVELQLQETLGHVYLGLGRMEQARVCLGRAMELARAHRAEDAGEIARLEVGLAETYWRQSPAEARQAIAMLDDTLARLMREVDDDDPVIAEVRVNRANALKKSGQIDEARVAYEAVLEQRLRIHGPNDERTLTTRYDLAILRVPEADAAEAAGHMEQARSILSEIAEELERIHDACEASLRTDATLTLEAASEIVKAHHRLKRFDKADIWYHRVMPVMRERFGDSHWRTREMMRSWASLYIEQKKFAEAKQVLVELVDGFRASTEVEELWLYAVCDLAQAHEGLGEDAQAERVMDEAFDHARSKGGSAARQAWLAKFAQTLRSVQGDAALLAKWDERLKSVDPAKG